MVTIPKKFVLLLVSLVLYVNLFAVNDGIKNGVQLFEAGELEKAKEFFENFVKENSENSEAFYYLGRILFEENDLKRPRSNLKKL